MKDVCVWGGGGRGKTYLFLVVWYDTSHKVRLGLMECVHEVG